MNNSFKAATIVLAASLVAGCAPQMSSEAMRATLTGQNVDVQIPPNTPNVLMGGRAGYAPTSGTAGSMAASNAFMYGHAAQLNNAASKPDTGVNMSSSVAYTIASSLRQKFGKPIPNQPAYKVQFKDEKYLIPSGLNTYWINYVMHIEVFDPQGKRISFAYCHNKQHDIHTLDEWRDNKAFVEELKNRLVATCGEQFSKVLGY